METKPLEYFARIAEAEQRQEPSREPLREPVRERLEGKSVIFDEAETSYREFKLRDRVKTLEALLDVRRDQWKVKINDLDRLNEQQDQREKELAFKKLREAEERNAALTRQFNELHAYCESLYQKVDGQREA